MRDIPAILPSLQCRTGGVWWSSSELSSSSLCLEGALSTRSIVIFLCKQRRGYTPHRTALILHTQRFFRAFGSKSLALAHHALFVSSKVIYIRTGHVHEPSSFLSFFPATSTFRNALFLTKKTISPGVSNGIANKKSRDSS